MAYNRELERRNLQLSKEIQKKDLREMVYKKTDGKCIYCGVDFGTGQQQYCIDHIVALKNWGDNSIDNLIPCCKSCNSTKGPKTLEEFRFEMLKKSGRYFTKNQVEYLRSIGIELPEAKYTFYFEEEHGER